MTEWLLVRVVVNASLSTWRRVTSGVPQELGQIPLNISVSSSDSGTTHTLSTFADDSVPCEGMPSRGTWTCLRQGPMQTSQSSTPWNATSYLGHSNPGHTRRGGQKSDWEQPCREGRGVMEDENSTWAISVCSQPRRPILGCTKRSVPSRPRGFSPSTLLWLEQLLELWSVYNKLGQRHNSLHDGKRALCNKAVLSICYFSLNSLNL